MKKYIALSVMFLLAAFPTLAKGSTDTGSQNTTGTQKIVSPTGNAVQNQNQVQTQNQGEEQQLSVKTQESEQLNLHVTQSLTKVSDQVHQLIDTVGAKGGIGQQVKVIAQDQLKVQDQIKSDFEGLNSRGALARLLVGSDKKLTQSLEQKMEQNRLMIQQLEELKLQIKNSGDLQQLQETIDLMIYQNTSLQNKIGKENKVNGMFGWLVNLFN
jgi:hypothetical protein